MKVSRGPHMSGRGLAPLIELMPMIYFYDLRLASATVCSSFVHSRTHLLFMGNWEAQLVMVLHCQLLW